MNRLACVNWPLFAIVVLGLGLRLWGIGFGLPYTYVADEPTRIAVSLNMLRTGDLDPHWLGYPHLMFYLNTFVLLFYFLVGRLAGRFDTPLDIPLPEVVTIGVGKLAAPEMFLVSRGLTVLMGTGAVVLVYLLGRQFSRRKTVGLIAALFFAVSPAGVLHSQMISLDMYGVFFLLLAFLWIDALNDDRSIRAYVIAGIGIGLAFSGKYNVGIVGISFVVAHFMLYGWKGVKQREFYFALLAGALAFAAVNPYSIVDPGGFLRGLGMASESQSQYAGASDSFQWYAVYLLSVEGWGIMLSVLEAVRILWNRSRRGLVLLSFPIAYVLFVSRFSMYNDRTILPVIPFLNVLTALLLVALVEKAKTLFKMPQVVAATTLTVLCGLHVVVPLRTALASDLRLTSTDGRETARRWLEANLPVGARVAVEGYSPYLDTRLFVIYGGMSMIEHPPDWYVQNGFEYLVFSQGIYGRFFAEPVDYAMWVADYTEFFERFPQVARFDDNGFEVRIHKTNARLPAHRVAARFGDSGDLIELVGYDTLTPHARPGDPLRGCLAWRASKPANQRLEFFLRLLNQSNDTVVTMRQDLFQRQASGWDHPQGIFLTEWTIPIPADAESGVYFLQVDVIQTRFAYVLPAQTWAGEPIPKVSLGTIKLSVPSPSSVELQSARAANARWDGQITLAGYLLDKQNSHAGDTLNLTLYWQSVAKVEKDYTVFVHIVDSSGNIHAQLDTQPRAGTYPTSIWDVGEIVRDEYALALPRELAPGEYRVAVGLYEYPSLVRARVQSGGKEIGDYMLLDEIVRVTP